MDLRKVFADTQDVGWLSVWVSVSVFSVLIAMECDLDKSNGKGFTGKIRRRSQNRWKT